MKVELLNVMGDDLMVVNAARVSFDKYHNAFTEGDIGLIRYLATHDHWTPFAHPQIQFRITVPIFVARQWFKHVVGTVRNEVSRRYVSDEPEFFTPGIWRGKPEGSIKQGSSQYAVSDEAQEIADGQLNLVIGVTENAYKNLLALGVAPEQARMVLPQCMYTSWIETGSLAFWARFCDLRLGNHAQEEIRTIASEISHIMIELFPESWKQLVLYKI